MKCLENDKLPNPDMLIYWDIAKDFSVYFSNLAEKLVFSTVKVPEKTIIG